MKIGGIRMKRIQINSEIGEIFWNRCQPNIICDFPDCIEHYNEIEDQLFAEWMEEMEYWEVEEQRRFIPFTYAGYVGKINDSNKL